MQSVAKALSATALAVSLLASFSWGGDILTGLVNGVECRSIADAFFRASLSCASGERDVSFVVTCSGTASVSIEGGYITCEVGKATCSLRLPFASDDFRVTFAGSRTVRASIGPAGIHWW
jgi:hypothetical protein